MMTEKDNMFHLGSLVWAKMEGSLPWPGMIIPPPTDTRKSLEKGQLCVLFFGTRNYSFLPTNTLELYESNRTLGNKYKKQSLRKAIDEIESYTKNQNEKEPLFRTSPPPTPADETAEKEKPPTVSEKEPLLPTSPLPTPADETAEKEETPTVSKVSWEPFCSTKCIPSTTKSDFAAIIKDESYVDKTEYLFKLLNTNDSYFILIRPRRFGKSLFLRTMEYFLKGRNDLFVSTAIYNRLRDYKWLKYPVIRLEFATLACKTSEKLEASLMAVLRKIAKDHGIILTTEDVATSIMKLIEELKRIYNGLNVAVLVDDYDSPLVNCPSTKSDEILDVMKTVFSTLKSKNEDILICFVTGITNVALSTIFSGFNNALCLTKEPEFAAAWGFTEEELVKYFSKPISEVASINGKNVSEILDELKTWFNGYRFTCSTVTVYNPCSILQYLRTKSRDKNFWSLTGGFAFLMQQINSSPYFTQSLSSRHLFNKLRNDTPGKLKFAIPEYLLFGDAELNPGNEESWAVLFHQLGIFTITECSGNAENRMYHLEFSNRENVSFYLSVLSNTVASAMSKSKDFYLNTASIQKSILEEDWDKFQKGVNTFLAQFPHTIFDFEKSTECVFQVVMFILMEKLGYDADLEVITSTGRIDLVAKKMHILLFELKIETNNETDALEQMEQCKKYVQGFFNTEVAVFCFGIQFSRATKRIKKFAVSKYAAGLCIY